MLTSSGSTAVIVSTLIGVIAGIGDIFVYTSGNRIARIVSTSVVIIASNRSVDASVGRITRVCGTFAVIIAGDKCMSTSFNRIATILSTSVVIVAVYWFVIRTSCSITFVNGASI